MTDPDLQASFAEALAKILGEFRDNWNKIYDELEKLRQRIINTGQGAHLRGYTARSRCRSSAC